MNHHSSSQTAPQSHGSDHQAGHNMSGHTHMDHSSDFMSMVMMTRDIAPAADGLRMDSADITLESNHPAMTAGVGVTLRVDGDTVDSIRLHNSAGQSLEKLARADSLQERLLWLSRFAELLGYHQLETAIASITRDAASGRDDQLKRTAGHWYSTLTSNFFLKWRLKGVAIYDGCDAYDRLLAGFEIMKSGPMSKSTTANHQAGYDSTVIAHSLTGLELGQALAGLASFDTAPIKGKL